MQNIAIIVICYNRVDSLARLLKSLSEADYSGDMVPLIISVDKSSTDLVEKYAQNYHWEHGTKHVITHEHNLGLRKHILSQSKHLESFDAIVVLEDDILVSPNFWDFVKQSTQQYADNDDVAGISLYNYAVTNYSRRPFVPRQNGYDAYMMNCAMSWGQVWLRKQFGEFLEWYAEHEDFTPTEHIPQDIMLWGEKSWLRYHTRYCIERNKYFVYPYVSLTTNCAEQGEHMEKQDTIYQVPLLCGKKEHYHLPSTTAEAECYDGYYENKALYRALALTENECCLDLMGLNDNPCGKRYWLTTRRLKYKVVRAFSCIYRPIEQNVLSQCNGNEIYLYDTTRKATHDFPSHNETFKHRYFIETGFFWARDYGVRYIMKEFFVALGVVWRRHFKHA